MWTTYAVWFKGKRVEKIEDVSEEWGELYEKHGGAGRASGEQVAAELEKILGASAIIYANSLEMAVAEAAEACGIDEIESEPDELPYWLR
jgi:uncharacterized protein YabN with tetrapyrrole methylase and pyrophosphatase domain